MAKIRVFTAARMKAIEDSAIVSGAINALGRLILKRHDGQEVDAGQAAVMGPVGTVSMFAGSSAPAGHLLCDGSAIPRTTYPELYALIGTTYGSGDGVSTFNLPNLKGRVVVGRDTAQTEFDTLGEFNGTKTVTQTVAQLAKHTHAQNPHSHGLSNNVVPSLTHRHKLDPSYVGARVIVVATANGVVAERKAVDNTWTKPWTATHFLVNAPGGGTSSTQSFFTPVEGISNMVETSLGDGVMTIGMATTTAVNQETGTSEPMNNLQPYLVMNYIIRY